MCSLAHRDGGHLQRGAHRGDGSYHWCRRAGCGRASAWTRHGLAESVAVAVLAAGAVFLWRKSANMPQLNNDGLSPFSANDWLAPTLTYVVLGMYASVRRPGNDRRFAQARALAVLAAFVVNVVTI